MVIIPLINYIVTIEFSLLTTFKLHSILYLQTTCCFDLPKVDLSHRSKYCIRSIHHLLAFCMYLIYLNSNVSGIFMFSCFANIPLVTKRHLTWKKSWCNLIHLCSGLIEQFSQSKNIESNENVISILFPRHPIYKCFTSTIIEQKGRNLLSLIIIIKRHTIIRRWSRSQYPMSSFIFEFNNSYYKKNSNYFSLLNNPIDFPIITCFATKRLNSIHHSFTLYTNNINL